MPRLRIVNEERDFPDRSSLARALQRWENEGGAGSGRLPASYISREAQPDGQAPDRSDGSAISAS